MVPMPKRIVIPCFQRLLQGPAWANVRRVCRMAWQSLRARTIWQSCRAWVSSNSNSYTFDRPQRMAISNLDIHHCEKSYPFYLVLKITTKKCIYGLGWWTKWRRCWISWWMWPTEWKPHTTPGLWMGFQRSRVLSSFENKNVHGCNGR